MLEMKVQEMEKELEQRKEVERYVSDCGLSRVYAWRTRRSKRERAQTLWQICVIAIEASYISYIFCVQKNNAGASFAYAIFVMIIKCFIFVYSMSVYNV